MIAKVRFSFIVLCILAAVGTLVVGARAQEDPSAPDGAAELAVDPGKVEFLNSYFTYQGYLTDGGGPANGDYDFRSSLYNAAAVGTQYGETDEDLNVTVTNGLFTIVIAPGPGVFDRGGTRWLELEVRPAGGGTYTRLSPRQEIRPVPQAIYAEYARNLVEPGDTIIQVSPFKAIQSDGFSNLDFAARGNGRLEISRSSSGNSFVYIPVDVPAQIFGGGQDLVLESLRFCYNGEFSGAMVEAGIVRATVRQVTDFSTGPNMLGQLYTPPLSDDDECVVVDATSPQEVTGSLWVRFEIIAGPGTPLELGEISLTFNSDN